jgi:hypothetical protein
LSLLPYIAFRHREKVLGKEIACRYDAQPWSITGPLYVAYRKAILQERDELVRFARRLFGPTEKRKQDKTNRWRVKVEATFPHLTRGLRIENIAKKLNCSIGKVYRRKQAVPERSRKTTEHRKKIALSLKSKPPSE